MATKTRSRSAFGQQAGTMQPGTGQLTKSSVIEQFLPQHMDWQPAAIAQHLNTVYPQLGPFKAQDVSNIKTKLLKGGGKTKAGGPGFFGKTKTIPPGLAVNAEKYAAALLGAGQVLFDRNQDPILTVGEAKRICEVVVY